jgi:hypothetical protein
MFYMRFCRRNKFRRPFKRNTEQIMNERDFRLTFLPILPLPRIPNPPLVMSKTTTQARLPEKFLSSALKSAI